jgi:pilus assembly protein Flp/PilA
VDESRHDQGVHLPMRKLMRRNKDRGATAVEYALMVALIAGVIIVIVTALGGGLKYTFDKVCDQVAAANCTP